MQLVDTVELAEELSKRVWYEREDEKQAVRIVKEFPTVDAMPVVRCRECKYGYTDENTLVCGYRGFFVSESFYCADGVRKDGADDELQ